MRRWLLLVSILILSTTAKAGTYTAASCAESDVNAVINGPTHTAVSGDIIVLPTSGGSCAATWTSELNIPVAATLECQTINAWSGDTPSTPGCTITDENPNGNEGQSCGNYTLICLNLDGTSHATIAGIALVTGTGINTGGSAGGDYLVVQGSGLVPLMHNMDFNVPNSVIAHAVQWLVTGGVIWNTNIESTDNLGAGCSPPGGPGSSSGSIVFKGQYNWDNASTMGTLDTTGLINTYIEDSQFSYVGQAPDVDDNARVVIRHTTWTNSTGGVGHGPTSTYGTRQVEMYNDTFTWSNGNIPANRYFWFRGGTAVITNNSVLALNSSCTSGPSFVFIVEDATRSTSHGCCTVYGCFHQPGTGANGVGGSSFQGSSSTPPDPYAISDPVYIWDNTGTGQATTTQMVGLNDEVGSGCNSGDTTATFFQQNRDYFVDTSSSSTGAKPGWAPYTYPHPLRFSSSTPQAATPSIIPSAGAYPSPQIITITDATSGATICWTFDGSTPTANGAGTCVNGTTYTVAFSESIPVTIKAIASEGGYTDSSAVSVTYTLAPFNGEAISGASLSGASTR